MLMLQQSCLGHTQLHIYLEFSVAIVGIHAYVHRDTAAIELS